MFRPRIMSIMLLFNMLRDNANTARYNVRKQSSKQVFLRMFRHWKRTVI